jgi:hypothetical protein
LDTIFQQPGKAVREGKGWSHDTGLVACWPADVPLKDGKQEKRMTLEQDPPDQENKLDKPESV